MIGGILFMGALAAMAFEFRIQKSIIEKKLSN
jgi:hypothetical protein